MHGVHNLRRLAGIDFNLLKVFRALDEFRHVTRAAKALGLTQPAMSHALNRLRALFDDPLFVKATHGMVPTPAAEALAPRVRDVFATLTPELFARTEFSPASLERTFQIQTTDLMEVLLMPRLLGVLAAEAPRVRFAATSPRFTFPREALETGACDLAIGGFFGELPDGFFRQPVLDDELRVAARRDHPRFGGKRKLTLAQYCDARHLLVAPGGVLQGTVDAALAEIGARRKVMCGISGFTVAGWITAGSDSLLTAPRRLIELFAQTFPIETFDPPFPAPKIHIVQVWHARQHRDAGHAWFRERVREAFATEGRSPRVAHARRNPIDRQQENIQ